MVTTEAVNPARLTQNIAAADIYNHRTENHRKMQERWLRHGAIEAHFAQVFGAPPEVQLGFYLHDIGKTESSPNAHVWNLPESRLADSDFADMRKHAQLGEEVLLRFQEKTGIEIPEVALQIVKYHHEKLDGSGPYGLKGKEIPYWVKFAVIVDQILSRCEYRPYRNINRSTFTLRQAFYDVNRGRYGLYDGEILDEVRHVLEDKLHWQLPLRKMALSFDVDGVLEDRGFYLQIGTLKKRLASFLAGRKGSIIEKFEPVEMDQTRNPYPDVDPLSFKEYISFLIHESRGLFPEILTEFSWLDWMRKKELSGLESFELIMNTGRSNQWDFRHMTEMKHALSHILYDRQFYKPKGLNSAKSKYQAIDQYLYENPDFFLIHYEDDPYTAFYMASLAKKYPGRVFVVFIDRDPRLARIHFNATDLERFDNLSVEPDLTAAFDTLTVAGFRPYNKKELMERWNLGSGVK